MSEPRDPWWPYIKNVLRAYPALQRELNARKRETWSISPVTRRPPDPKAYKRRNRKIRIEEE